MLNIDWLRSLHDELADLTLLLSRLSRPKLHVNPFRAKRNGEITLKRDIVLSPRPKVGPGAQIKVKKCSKEGGSATKASIRFSTKLSSCLEL